MGAPKKADTQKLCASFLLINDCPAQKTHTHAHRQKDMHLLKYLKLIEIIRHLENGIYLLSHLKFRKQISQDAK